MANDPKATINKYLNEHDVVVFSKTYCPYCTKAKTALKAVGAKFEAVELDERADGNAIQQVCHLVFCSALLICLQALAELTGRRTVPNVFVHKRSIGGGDDTEALQRSGKLKELIDKKAQL